VLVRGAVREIVVKRNPAFNSAITHLQVTYGPEAFPGAPSALLLKLNLDEEWAREAGRAEVAFYQEVGAARGDLTVIVPCYEAMYDRTSGNSHLLLLDVSETHEPLVTRDHLIGLHGVFSEARLQAAVNAIASIHAHWWQDPPLLDGSREVSGWYGARERFDDRIVRRRGEWKEFRAGSGADLPPDLVSLYQLVLDRLPVLWDRGLGDRMASARNLTLVHGDCYLSQFLYPRDGRGTTYLVDWQGAQTDLPTRDLAHMFATFWTPEQRHAGDRERRLLQKYLDLLSAAGVEGYGWEQLQWDYRMLLIYIVLHPIWDAVVGAGRDYWWPTMQCRVSAYRDWACEQLLS
jgi:hypothetical protein